MLLITVTAAVLSASEGTMPALRSGDIVLQASQSGMSDSIQRATSSKYSHVGVVEVTSKGAFVFEALDSVSRTPFEKWRARGRGGHFTVMRPRLDARLITSSLAAARRELGKPYDTHYSWDDEKMYCSELVVKAFERGAHLHLGKMVRLDSLKLTDQDKAVAAFVGVPLSQQVVPPGSFVEDPQLENVFSDMP